MKKLWIRLGIVVGSIVALGVIFMKSKEIWDKAHIAVLSKNPLSDLAHSVENYTEKLQEAASDIEKETKEAIVERFKHAFGG